MMKWVSVKDRLPEWNKEVLGYYNFQGCAVTYVYQHNGTVWDGCGSPDYWMELPEPPKDCQE